jgi:membrane-bound lytic murein transglycosylase B
MRRKILIVGGLVLSLSISAIAIAKVFSERPEVTEFINELSQEHKLDKQQLISAFSKIESSDEVIKRITTPAEALPWDKYQKLFLDPKRINEGVSFWQKNAKTLTQAEQKFGVPAELIVAIIGVESFYGVNRGKYPVLQALATLAFDYPPRSKFFRSELKEYLLLVTEQRLDPLALMGSYAGAMGTPQFIASSYRNYAVDFDQSGQIDLINNISQAIGSVANYFHVHGWIPGQPIAYKAKTKGSKFKNLEIAAKNSPKPVLSLSTLKQHGVTADRTIDKNAGDMALLEFENGDKKEYWLGSNNFYVITRYNHSSNYAMAVYQLSQKIAKLYKQKPSIK